MRNTSPEKIYYWYCELEDLMKEKIMVVDDVDTIARVYARFLERMGYDVRIAFNGVEALEVWESYQPDLIISDIRMPKMNGFELANTIRNRKPDQKIILMTGYADEAEVLEQQKSHGFPFFTKPADLQTTVSKIVKDVLADKYKSN
jgi:two-component system response regulator AtoC